MVGGAGDKGVCVWDISKGEPVEGCLRPSLELEYPKDGATCVAFNPRNSLFATARKEVVSILILDYLFDYPHPSHSHFFFFYSY